MPVSSRVLSGILVPLAIAEGACSAARYGGPDGNAGLTLPAPIAEGKPKGSEIVHPVEPGPATERDRRRASSQTKAPRRPMGGAPDPAPLVLKDQWRYRLGYQGGRTRVLSTHALTLAAPTATARRMGRFAIELFIGDELIDRVRFDFPLLGDAPPEGPGLNWQLGVKSEVTVLVPRSPRARRALLVDRATGERIELPWPPDEPLPPP